MSFNIIDRSWKAVTQTTMNDDVVLHHTFPVFTGLGQCPIVDWDCWSSEHFFGPDALPVNHQ